ncbi:FIG00482145: hypothetical protein [hydrothermal vent metagenome]|uniref:DUF885 domain-containing protein n=1 Tax=hydrothermal vent metagenome TaxID=652676 RepID=A0A3B0RLH7_9ZZZZ
MKYLAAAVASFLLAACGGEADTASSPEENTSPSAIEVEADNAAENPDASAVLDELAEAFVKLSLAIGVLDPAFVDAYHGPKEWADAAAGQAQSFEALAADAQALLIKVARANADAPSLRGAMLEKLVRASVARIEIAQGQFYPFNEETRLLYDAVAPQYDVDEFYAVLAEIDTLLPGEGPLYERVDAFRNSLAIAKDKLLPVFNAAIAECRKRTLAHYQLPDNERFRLEFVTGKPWSGYNWYQGDYESLIQVNTDFPIIIDRAVDLGCHEGYPGHHTWNIMIERDFLKGNGWIEYSVYPLFSPLSVTAEGSANYGIELAFPGDEKITFERDVLFPLAGLNPEDAEKLDQLNKARRKLSHSRNYIARAYLDGDIDRGEAIRLSMEFGLQSRERAEQGVRFIETYRGYVINYNLGRDLVENYVNRKAVGRVDTWLAFRTLLTTPLAASDIEAAQ